MGRSDAEGGRPVRTAWAALAGFAVLSVVACAGPDESGGDMAAGGLEGADDREGCLWIERSSQDGVGDGPIDIVTSDGGYVGTLGPDGPQLPNAFGPGGLMAYLIEDDLGVQTISVLRLVALEP